MKDNNFKYGGDNHVHGVCIDGRTYIVEDLIRDNEYLEIKNKNQEQHIENIHKENAKLTKEIVYANITHEIFQQYKKAYRDLCKEIYSLENYIRNKIRKLVGDEYLNDTMCENQERLQDLLGLLCYVESNFNDLEDV